MLNDKRFKEKRGSQLFGNIIENHQLFSSSMPSLDLTTLSTKDRKTTHLPFYPQIDGKAYVPYWFSFENGTPRSCIKEPSWRVSQASNEKEIQLAWNLWQKNFPVIGEDPTMFLELCKKQAIHEKGTFQILIGYLNDIPVAASILFLASHTAVVYCLSVNIQEQNTDIAKELIIANMKRAKELYYPGIALLTDSKHLKSELMIDTMGFNQISLKKTA